MKKIYLILLIGFLLVSSMGSVLAQRLTHLLNRQPGVAKAAMPTVASPNANAPTITSVSLTATNAVTIVGTNLNGVTSVKFGTVVAASVDSHGAPTSIVATPQAGSSLSDGITVVTSNGTATFTTTGVAATAGGPNAAADFTVPNLGQGGVNIVVTPSFAYNQIYSGARLAFSGSVWGNNFGTDSIKSNVGAKFLLPESSTFGFKLEGAYAINPGTDVVVGIAAEANFLSKKVAFFDTTSKVSTNFSPFVIHPKVGLTCSFFKSAVVASAYLNVLAVETENDNFSKFFNTNNKSVFVYPEFNISGIINLSDGSNQAINVGFEMISNNSDAKLISSTTDKMIVYLKIGFVSKL